MKQDNLKILAVGSLQEMNFGQTRAFSAAVNGYKAQGFQVKFVESSFRGRLGFLTLAKYLLKLVYYLISSRFDVVYFLPSRSVIGTFRDLYLLFLLRLFNKSAKSVAHLHGSDFKQFFNSRTDFQKKIIRNEYKQISKFVVLTDKMKDQFIDTLNCNPNIIYTLNNFFEPNNNNISFEEKYSADDISFIYLSSIAKTKGILDAIDIIYELRKLNVNATLDVAGAMLGDRENTISQIERSFYESLNKFDWITYHHLVDGPEKYSLLSKSLFFILPSHYVSEALPLSIIEAMSCGCGILTTKVGYISELIVDEKNGFILAEPKNATLTARRIVDIIKNRKKLKVICKSGQEEVNNNYTAEAYQKNLIKIILN